MRRAAAALAAVLVTIGIATAGCQGTHGQDTPGGSVKPSTGYPNTASPSGE